MTVSCSLQTTAVLHYMDQATKEYMSSYPRQRRLQDGAARIRRYQAVDSSTALQRETRFYEHNEGPSPAMYYNNTLNEAGAKRDYLTYPLCPQPIVISR